MNPYHIWVGHIPADQCDQIIADCEQYPIKDAEVSGENTYRPEVRRSKIRWIPPSFEQLTNFIFGYFAEANRGMGIDIRSIFEIQFSEYDSSYEGHFDWHSDTELFLPNLFQRKLSFSMQLSDPDDYEGGDFELYDITNSLEDFRQRGSIIVFPSILRHRVTPVTKGTRKALVSWIEGPAWR
jgi:PKHD-type hydroxylase